MKKLFFIGLLILSVILTGCSSDSNPQAKQEKELIAFSEQYPEFKIKDNKVENADPAILYAYSNYLFEKDKKDDAVFWYYLAQLRNRYLLAVSKVDQPVNPALFARFYRASGFIGNLMIVDSNYFLASSDPSHSKMNSIYDSATRKNIHRAASGLGEFINPYAFENLDRQMERIDQVIAYENAHPINAEALVAPDNLVSKEEQQLAKNEIVSGLEEFKQYIQTNKDYIKEQRTKNGLNNE